MDLLTSDLQRALLYVLLLNDNDAYPTKDNVNDFVQTSMPKPSTTGTKLSALLGRIAMGDMMSPQWEPGGPVSDYMLSMGWILEGKNNGKVHITMLGRALCSGFQSQNPMDFDDATIYSTTPDEPVALSKLIGLLKRSESQLYIDPYLEPDHVEMLSKTPVRRVVTGKKFAEEIAVRLAEIPFPEDFQVRIFEGEGLHDRGAVHANGGVAIVGTSMNSMHGKYVAMVDLPPRISGTYSNILEGIWEDSKLLEPKYPESRNNRKKPKGDS